MGAYSSAVRILLALLPLSAAAQEVTLVMQPAVREAGALVVRGTVTNQIDTDVTNVNVVVRLQDGSQTVLTGRSDDTWSCRDNGTPQSVRCTAAVLRAKSSAPVTLTLAAEHGR